MVSKKVQKSSLVYNCTCCDYSTIRPSQYERHLMTPKHRMITNGNEKSSKQIQCDCGKVYKHLSGLSRHKKDCKRIVSHETNGPTNEFISQPPTQVIDGNLVIELLKQNQEFKELMMEQSKQLVDQQQQNQFLLEQQQRQNNNILEAVKDGKIGNTINNTTNKFNLNLFLNETCKDAITMNDFINSFEVTREDFIRTGNVGFVEGISTVMMKRIRNMELHTRPLHCTDLKRETVYIKNDDKWEKEDIDKTHLRKAVKTVAHKNMNELKQWYCDSKPEVDTIGTDEYENYFKYYQAALGGYDKEEDVKFEEKIIKNVLKEVQVDKTITTY
jgi:hypothetical protein